MRTAVLRWRPVPLSYGAPVVGRRRLREVCTVLAAVVLVLAAGWVTVRPALLNVGSTRAEQSAAMPGDDAVVEPRTVMTRSVTLDGTPPKVWPWLVQMGVGKGGFYGYDWLENLGPAGVLDDIRNADRVHPEWQRLQVGDHVLPLPGATSWTVTELVPERRLVITDGGSWSWALVLRPAGPGQTRLVTRMRWAQVSGVNRLSALVFDMGDLITVARTLRGLDQRVDGTLPGMPGTSTGAPAPTARLPVSAPEALAWLLLLIGLAAAAGRLLVTRRGGWLVSLSATTVLAWCLTTDTDPWQALAHRWPVAMAATLATAAASLALRRGGAVPALGTWLRGLPPTLAAVGVAVIVPALTVWDATTSAGATDGTAGRVGAGFLAVAGAMAVSVAFWYGAGGSGSVAGLTGVGAVAALALVSGSVLAAAVPAAVLLPRTDSPAVPPASGKARPQLQDQVVNEATGPPAREAG
jgi:hypothetical protein